MAPNSSAAHRQWVDSFGDLNARITDGDLPAFEEALFVKKHEILQESRAILASGKIACDTNELKDEADHAAFTLQQDLTLALVERNRNLLKEIEWALAKIKTGEYGYCEGTGEPIPKKRLVLTPWVKYSVDHQSEIEREEKLRRQIAKAGEWNTF